ncbi:MAG: hypothetical protein WBC05_09130, partial [Sedimentisphaerales bacterium]
MLARKSKLRHPASDVVVETPLLVPAFSSKGFDLFNRGKGTKDLDFFGTKTALPEDNNPTSGLVSEVTEVLRAVGPVLTESLLVSAYDIFHRHIPLPYSHASPEIIFVDSGGYEKEDGHDFSAIFRNPPGLNDWDIQL